MVVDIVQELKRANPNLVYGEFKELQPGGCFGHCSRCTLTPEAAIQVDVKML